MVVDGSKLAIFGPGGLYAPPVVADKAKQAIVFTYFFPLHLLLFTHFGETPMAKNWFPLTRRIIYKKKYFRYFFFFL